MTLRAGTRLGPCEILGLIGAGGMGQVYRARDSRLDRDVALKVLPETLSTDADRVARLEREAKLLASLNHPNIATIYELLDSDGRRVLVMELVEGLTLADRLTAGPVTTAETLSIFRQIADGLEAAHERGVVHRDLKPANIKTPPDARVKILDFGIATTVGDRAAGVKTPGAETGATTAVGLTGDAVLERHHGESDGRPRVASRLALAMTATLAGVLVASVLPALGGDTLRVRWNFVLVWMFAVPGLWMTVWLPSPRVFRCLPLSASRLAALPVLYALLLCLATGASGVIVLVLAGELSDRAPMLWWLLLCPGLLTLLYAVPLRGAPGGRATYWLRIWAMVVALGALSDLVSNFGWFRGVSELSLRFWPTAVGGLVLIVLGYVALRRSLVAHGATYRPAAPTRA